MSLLQGKDLIVMVDVTNTADSETKRIFCATNATLTINQDAIQATCKDTDGWQGNIGGMRNWEITTDALYDPSTQDGGFVNIAALILNDMNDITIIFGQELGQNNEVQWSGSAICTSCSLTGAIEDVATWSATFVGNGELQTVQV